MALNSTHGSQTKLYMWLCWESDPRFSSFLWFSSLTLSVYLFFFFSSPRCGVTVDGQHQGKLLGEQQAASPRGAVERGRLHLLPVCGRRAALHGHGLQTELPEPGQDPRRVLSLLRRYSAGLRKKRLSFIIYHILTYNSDLCGVHISPHTTCRRLLCPRSFATEAMSAWAH